MSKEYYYTSPTSTSRRSTMSDFCSRDGEVSSPSLHHPKEQAGYLRSVGKCSTAMNSTRVSCVSAEAWNVALSREKDSRCGGCWLRSRQCYCGQFTNRRRALVARFGAGTPVQDTAKDLAACAEEEGVLLKHCEVLMYYHHDEIGRSCNTGHVLERLSPRYCRALVHGDEGKVNLVL